MIDAFPHILPPRYHERCRQLFPQEFGPAVFARTPSLYDLDQRFRVMEGHPGYLQVLTLASPPVESLGDGSQSAELATLANDSMAELCEKYPDRFLGFACALPMHLPDVAIRELERAVHDLGALGVQIHTNVRGAALDEGRFDDFWATCARLDVPVWVHPARGPQFPDYLTEDRSRFGAFVAFGWPYETAVFMTRLVFSGHLDRYPNLRILTHHAGGMIPAFAQRVGKAIEKVPGWPEDPAALNARAMALFKRFYGDTALNGNLAAVECGLAFWGPERLLFGTDFPFDDQNGVAYVRDTIANVEALNVPAADRLRIFESNAREVLGVRE